MPVLVLGLIVVLLLAHVCLREMELVRLRAMSASLVLEDLRYDIDVLTQARTVLDPRILKWREHDIVSRPMIFDHLNAHEEKGRALALITNSYLVTNSAALRDLPRMR